MSTIFNTAKQSVSLIDKARFMFVDIHILTILSRHQLLLFTLVNLTIKVVLNRIIRRGKTDVLRCSFIILSNVGRAFIRHFKEVHWSIDNQFIFLFLLLLELADVFWSAATAKIAPAMLRSKHVQYSSEEAHCGQERENDG